MSLIAIVIGVGLGLVGSLRVAVIAAAGIWAATTLYLALVADSPTSDSAAHDLTAGFWVTQGAILLVALLAAWSANRLRARRVR